MKLSSIFTHEQMIYHATEEGTWIGQYDAEQEGILYDGVIYRSLYAFARAHSGKPCSGWRECRVEYNGGIIEALELKRHNDLLERG
jgi:hypothetical protein